MFVTGCFHNVFAQAAISRAAAAKRFLKKNATMPTAIKHLSVKSCCEIDKSCQDVLKATYASHDPCIFTDVTKIGGRESYCVAHGECCPTRPYRDSDRPFLRPHCLGFSSRPSASGIGVNVSGGDLRFRFQARHNLSQALTGKFKGIKLCCNFTASFDNTASSWPGPVYFFQNDT